MYEDERDLAPNVDVSTGEKILKEEVEHVMKMIQNVKATGTDDIPIEALKTFDEHNLEVVTELCNTIYNSGYIPTDMKQSIFIPLPKKPKAEKCTEFRTISLMTNISKLLLKIIQQRIADKIDKEVSRLQSGFRAEMGTREGIFNLRTICERTLEVNQDVYICFIDYKKAFDRVNHSKMIECLSGIGVDGKDLRIIATLYWEQTGIVKIEGGVTSEFKIKRGVRQGCVLSSSLFNL